MDRQVRHLKNLLSWWNSLSEVERSVPENVTKLIMQGESIICNEHRAWSSVAADASSGGAHRGKEGAKEEDEEDSDSDGGKGKEGGKGKGKKDGITKM